ncbi:hypothetical protein Micbo1qcDRAFT_200027 [Microdochium bolleyi]|uniref:Uncharacterized protein n=1 Tax=Microdochium bolleyi TaxID=196109 RepID=A0A136JJI9_9PEZI|nr:hypothetical protein Micbo1qcDRAFT_200027 [Microdochium bolleyi]
MAALAASITNGPLAPVTVGQSNMAYSTARECAKYCLQYGGQWMCGVNAGYYGLGWGLGCGCASTNGCFCATGLASSATNYLSACISSRCKGVAGDGWTKELDSMLGLYDGYCSTANIDTGGPASWTPSTKTTTGVAGTNPTGGAAVTGSGPTNAAASATSTGDAAAGEGGGGGKSGLSQSDIIALAASLGVGVPSLLIAGITLWAQLRKKKRANGAAATGGNDHSSLSSGGGDGRHDTSSSGAQQPGNKPGMAMTTTAAAAAPGAVTQPAVSYPYYPPQEQQHQQYPPQHQGYQQPQYNGQQQQQWPPNQPTPPPPPQYHMQGHVSEVDGSRRVW